MSVKVLKVCKPGYLGPANLMVVTLEDHEGEVAKINAENESLRKDAERYRYARDNLIYLSDWTDDEIDGAISSPENPS